MAKMVPLRKTAADKRAEDHAGDGHTVPMLSNPDDDEGPTLHLEAHHLNKLGVEGELPEGHEIEFRGRVEAHQHGHDEGENRGHARIRITHAGTDKPDDKEHTSLRDELKKRHGEAEKKSEAKAG